MTKTTRVGSEEKPDDEQKMWEYHLDVMKRAWNQGDIAAFSVLGGNILYQTECARCIEFFTGKRPKSEQVIKN